MINFYLYFNNIFDLYITNIIIILCVYIKNKKFPGNDNQVRSYIYDLIEEPLIKISDKSFSI